MKILIDKYSQYSKQDQLLSVYSSINVVFRFVLYRYITSFYERYVSTLSCLHKKELVFFSF